MAERLRAPDSSSCVSGHQSVGSSPGHDTCVLEQDTLPYCFVNRVGHLASMSWLLGLVLLHVKEPRTLIVS